MDAPRVLVVQPPERSDRVGDALAAAGCAVRTAATATEALATLGSEPIDCVVSELDLAGDDGLALRSTVRQLEPELPFVLLTDREASDLPVTFDTPHDSYVDTSVEGTADRVVSAVTESDATATPQDITGHEPDAEEILRAIDAAPIGISLSDPSLPDNPLVYVNETWEEFTGYETEEVLGRNPRLLQGPQTDGDSVGRIAAAIDDEEPTTTELRNYRKDGTPFWNELTIAPIHDGDGDIAHYVGFQVNVTDRREAEELAAERAETLAAERQTLQRVLERVNGLLREISGVLVESTDRQMIEDKVCETIAATEGYTAGWIGAVDDDAGTLTLTASSGLAATGTLDLAALPPAISAATDGDASYCVTGSGGPLDPHTVGAEQLGVIPLRYGERRYGLLGVYGTDCAALDERERAVFESLGRMIANGLHAIETTRILTTDQVTELRLAITDGSLPLSQVAAAIDSPVDHVGMTPTGDGGCEWYCTAEPTGVDAAAVESLPCVRAARTVSETASERTLAVTVESAALHDRLADHGGVVSDFAATATGAELTVEIPPEQSVRSLLDTLRAAYDGVDLRGRTERDRRDRGRGEFIAEIDEKLTDRQQAALTAAALNDYFAWPRPVDGSEIAATMDITRQTFHQHLRAAERKLVSTYLDAGAD